MTDLSDTELRRLDLTLLLVLLGLLKYRKASDVAESLGLTQSAISQALKRLRSLFKDELFLRRPHGMEPTATALALEAPVTAAVEALRGALGTAQRFDPATARGTVRIAALDAQQAVLIPQLAQLLRTYAPGLNLSVLPLGRDAAVDALVDNRVDLALGFLLEQPDSISGLRLYKESFCVVGRPDALPDAPAISLEAFCSADHVLVSPGGEMRGIVDEELDRIGQSRRVSLGLPAFLPALAAVSVSGALVTLPTSIAHSFAPGFGLVVAAPPIAVRPFPVSVFWHRRNERDPRTRWLVDRLAEHDLPAPP
ncbi:LysR substrate-binding domain-containing protein [Lutimaribacter marinistellae]|uniref:LysR substrate-binding domain-containing protein n=1 Tax=Lutimaribacter marinistellae TaxID=1820329 RepID=A0ABV7TEK3_9RHOB